MRISAIDDLRSGLLKQSLAHCRWGAYQKPVGQH
jgi:hypothetical protein